MVKENSAVKSQVDRSKKKERKTVNERVDEHEEEDPEWEIIKVERRYRRIGTSSEENGRLRFKCRQFCGYSTGFGKAETVGEELKKHWEAEHEDSIEEIKEIKEIKEKEEKREERLRTKLEKPEKIIV